mmetsp:Transcript_2412/g.5751  ORF Transcript_2412/g.5751 Transcript_2412/m.5751 type:complete len:202 (-) Transcript_2412:1100-1705(-)
MVAVLTGGNFRKPCLIHLFAPGILLPPPAHLPHWGPQGRTWAGSTPSKMPQGRPRYTVTVRELPHQRHQNWEARRKGYMGNGATRIQRLLLPPTRSRGVRGKGRMRRTTNPLRAGPTRGKPHSPSPGQHLHLTLRGTLGALPGPSQSLVAPHAHTPGTKAPGLREGLGAARRGSGSRQRCGLLCRKTRSREGRAPPRPRRC